MRRHVHTITEKDVGASVIHAAGKVFLTSNFMGRILPGDVGKRIYLIPDDFGGYLQVENDCQRDARMNRESVKKDQGEFTPEQQSNEMDPESV